MEPLVQSSRSPEEVPTASMAGDEMDALLASERPAPRNVIATNTPSAQAAAVMTTGERPRISFPSMPGEATVVIAPELTTQRETELLPPAPAGQVAAAPLVASAAPAADPFAVAPPPWLPPASPIAPLGHQSAGGPPIPVLVPPPPSRAGLFFVLGGATLLAMAIGGLVFGLRGDPSSATDPQPSAEPITTAQPSATARAPAPTATAASSPGSKAISPPPEAPAGSPEAEAMAALGRLREGLAGCVRDVIGVLPGSSPAVPPSFQVLARGPYKSSPRDFRSPVFSCIRYRETEPQRFQIQWQMVKHPGEGRGVAWIDDNGDGKPDRAFGFRAALVQKNEVDLGEIGPLSPIPAVVFVRE